MNETLSRGRKKKLLAAALAVLASALGVAAYFSQKRFTDVRECEERREHACFRMAVRYEHGQEVEVDLVKARMYYARALEAYAYTNLRMGAAEALAPLLEHGRGGPVDIPRALELYDMVCRYDTERHASFSTSCYAAQQIRARSGAATAAH